jgi:hypothetical protein
VLGHRRRTRPCAVGKYEAERPGPFDVATSTALVAIAVSASRGAAGSAGVPTGRKASTRRSATTEVARSTGRVSSDGHRLDSLRRIERRKLACCRSARQRPVRRACPRTPNPPSVSLRHSASRRRRQSLPGSKAPRATRAAGPKGPGSAGWGTARPILSVWAWKSGNPRAMRNVECNVGADGGWSGRSPGTVPRRGRAVLPVPTGGKRADTHPTETSERGGTVAVVQAGEMSARTFTLTSFRKVPILLNWRWNRVRIVRRISRTQVGKSPTAGRWRRTSRCIDCRR